MCCGECTTAKVVLIVGERGRSLAIRSLEISMLTNNSDSNHVNNYRYYINDIYTTLIQQMNYTERYGISLLLHNCQDRFHIQVFIRSSNIWLSYIPSHLFTTSRVYLEPTQWPAPNWLVSSVGRALHRYRRGHGFKSRTGLNFFRAFFSLLRK